MLRLFASKRASLTLVTGLIVVWSTATRAQTAAKDRTAADDHRQMMERLGIKALRPAASGNEKDATHANYDESKANPYPDLPDFLTLKSGKKVTSAAQWPARRAALVEDFEREVYGRIPANVPRVTWTVTETDTGTKGLGRSDDYKTEKMPHVNVGLLDGQLAWRQHDGGHTDTPNWKYFLPWTDKFLR